MPMLKDYRPLVGEAVLDRLIEAARPLRGLKLVHVNSARDGGGVAEMLHRLVPLFNELGLATRWEVMEGTPSFFRTTKAFHNALQGRPQAITPKMLEEYRRVNAENARAIDLEADVVVIHDPQPAALIEARSAVPSARWVWRCHLDMSQPQAEAWALLEPYLRRYDVAVFSMAQFRQALPIPQYLIPPSIDPLSDKNRQLPARAVEGAYARSGVPRDKPVLLQVSRFDRFKDPLGVIAAYRQVKRDHDCRLVLAGGTASDDPEGAQVLAEVRAQAREDADLHILDLPPQSDLLINALQRGAQVVLQKSVKEGFGLTVTEALWKAKPVVAGAVGGITLQVEDGLSGYLVRSVEEAAQRVSHLLDHPEEARRLGRAGQQHVRERFLITRHLLDWLRLLQALAPAHPSKSPARGLDKFGGA